MSLQDDLSTEVDRRKIIKLINDGVITEREVQEADIIYTCPCGTTQNALNDNCIDCGEEI